MARFLLPIIDTTEQHDPLGRISVIRVEEGFIFDDNQS